MAISAIAGLGNPGSCYAKTRHNIGAEFVERFGMAYSALWKSDKRLKCEYAKIDLRGRSLYLVKPTELMNHSGVSLGHFARYFQVDSSEFIIAYDDITLELGRLRVTTSGGAGGHNGVADILQHLGTGFVRFRIGIGGKPHPDAVLSDWVLGKFSREEQAFIDLQMDQYSEGLRLVLQEGAEKAMNQLNQRKPVKQSNERNSSSE